MENEVLRKKLYLSEFVMFDDSGNLITFNIVDIDTEKKEITAAITDEGRISVCRFELKSDGKGFYFEYGVMLNTIAVEDFRQVEEK